jgi:ComF family protein
VRCGDHVANDMNGTIRVCHDCMRASSAIACATAIGPHVETLRSIVHALKYDGRRSIARPLAAMMRAEGAALIARCEVAVPVPLHAARRRSRGFNQAEDLALHVGLPVVRALTRIRHTDTQTALPAAERHQNVAGAFRPTRRAARVRGRSVLLIDDVRTTGATLEECALTLRGVGAGEVCALTAARVAPPDG